MEFGALTAKLADIRENIVSMIEKINTSAGGEAFYARFFFGKDELIGLVSGLGVNGYKIFFTLTEDKSVEGKNVREVSSKEISLEEINRIEPLRTLSGKPMFPTLETLDERREKRKEKNYELELG